MFARADGALLKARFEQLCGEGLCVLIDYSGEQGPEQGPEWACQYLDIGLRAAGASLPETLFKFYRSCDNVKLCQDVAICNGLSEHVFPSLEARLPATHAKKIAALELPASSPPEQRAAAYKDWKGQEGT